MPGQGILSRCALGFESTWGTGVAVTEVLPFRSESIERAIAQVESEFLDGNAGRRSIKNSLVSITGALEGDLIYDEISGDPIGIERIIRGAMGISARDVGNGINQYTLDNTLPESYTVAFNKQTSVWEIHGLKWNTLTISGNAGENIQFSSDVIGEDLLRTGDAGIVNAAAAITGLSPVQPTHVHFDDMVIRIADQVDALASGDRYTISSFSFEHNNNLSDPQFGSINASHADSQLTLEPVRNGFRQLDFNITLPRYDTDQFFTWHKANTALQIDIKFATGSFEFNIFIPNCHVGSNPGAPIAGAELIEKTVPFRCVRNAGANTFLTLTDTQAIVEEFAIEAKSNRTTQA